MKSSTGKWGLCLKLLIFSLLACNIQPAVAEYYYVDPQSYSYNESCQFCTGYDTAFKKHHYRRHSSRHHYRSRTGLFVYYPVTTRPCACCSPPPPQVGGEYVTFSTHPAREPRQWPREVENRYDADLTTADDIHPDMERN